MENIGNIKNKLPENLSGVHIHFVGIKGTGMAALVEILYHNGAIITGSDVEERFYTDEILESLGIKAKTFSKENITDKIEYVIYSSAYKLDKNPDLIAAVEKNLPCLLYTQALGSYSSLYYSCGVCGVHGKTSTTGLVGTILKELDLPTQTLVGSKIKSFGDTCTFTSDAFKQLDSNVENRKNSVFVAETCEYQRHFMEFFPKNIILTSVESDHQDYYPTYESIRDAFVDYICKLPIGGNLIFCSDDKGAVETALIAKSKRGDINFIPYGINDFSCDLGFNTNPKNGRVKALNEVSLDRTYLEDLELYSFYLTDWISSYVCNHSEAINYINDDLDFYLNNLAKAQSLNPRDIWPQYWISYFRTEKAISSDKKKDYRKAMKEWEKLFKNDLFYASPIIKLAYQKMAFCAEKSGDKEKATIFQNEAEKVNPFLDIDFEYYQYFGW